MRIISGEYRGRKLTSVPGRTVRPTCDKIKEAIFSAIQFDVPGASFLDLFAGSGQMGIEAISRGARQSVFVDFKKNSLEVINQNLSFLSLSDKFKVVNSDSLLFLKNTDQLFDVIFLDPPYLSDLLEKSLDLMNRVTNKNGIVICESQSDKKLPDLIPGFNNLKKYRYGKINVNIYRR